MSLAVDSNQMTYNLSNVVTEYAQQDHLLPAEETVLCLFKDQLAAMRMLDIGVGGGRTTLHFAPLVKEYVGVDYAEEMIEACRKRFGGSSPHISFQVGDVRAMWMFKDNEFDFLLLSYNSIDSIAHEDRLKAFSEIQRVGKAGGWFLFSTHNLKNYFPMFDLKKQVNFRRPRTTIKNLARWVRVCFIYNRYATIRKLKAANYAVINDGVHDWGLQLYYSRPTEQINQLTRHFDEIRVFSSTGLELKETATLNNTTDNYFYYLCRIR